jgi:CspA family cold shock protein
MVATKRYQGTVKVFDYFGGAGTILMSDGREVQVRYSSIRGNGIRSLTAGENVSFSLQKTRRGLYAVCVQQE